MASIELTGRVTEDGQIEFETPENLPPGEIHITIEFSDEALAADEKRWDELFAQSQDFLDELADEIDREYRNGQTREFDPDDIDS